MRGTVAKRIRAQEKAEGITRTPKLNPTTGPSRAEKRMQKFNPARYEDLQLENDPAVRRTRIRRWTFIYSPKLREKFSSSSDTRITTSDASA